jgi:hypothetical protein
MSCEMLPELRPYLEGILDEALEQRGMMLRNEKRRERVLCRLYKQFEAFLFSRLSASLPPSAREQFTCLLEQGASEEALQAFTTHHIHNIPVLVQQIFVEFREQYVKPKAYLE